MSKGRLDEILGSVFPYGGNGYKWEVLKGELPESDKVFLYGMAYAYDCVESCTYGVYDDFSDEKTIMEKIVSEVSEKAKQDILADLESGIGMMLTSMGDELAEQEE